jgi:hypothetical protein
LRNGNYIMREATRCQERLAWDPRAQARECVFLAFAATGAAGDPSVFHWRKTCPSKLPQNELRKERQPHLIHLAVARARADALKTMDWLGSPLGKRDVPAEPA